MGIGKRFVGYQLEGRKFGDWTVKSFAFRKYQKLHWLCECKCGKTQHIASSTLISGSSTKCTICSGSRLGEQITTHGFCKNRKKPLEYHIWRSMIDRCSNKNCKSYSRYGGRGITVCERWRKCFKSFIDDMGFKPFKTASIDRIDNDGNYCKENCRWTTHQVQAINKRSATKINGLKVSVTQEAKKINKCRFFVARKLKEGFSLSDIKKMKCGEFKDYSLKIYS